MKTSAPFEIRVALIGYVSVGKTTILNALLRDKYSEVSMKRTTAGVNLFRLHCDPRDDDAKTDSSATPEKGNQGQWFKDEARSADSTLEEIRKDNISLRNSNTLQEKVFDIELEKDLLEMRENTKLVFVDVPGINEAGSSEKYKNYVSDHWHKFDCVIVVMDGRQGVNTEEQMELLRLTQENCKTIRDLPLVVLMNKIDDAEDEEQKALVEEARLAVEKMFNTLFTRYILDDILNGRAQRFNNIHMPPVLIPLSAIHAFIYRTASTLSFDVFEKKMDQTLIDRLGRDSYGRRWKKFESDEKVQKAYEIIQNPEECEEGLEASNFNAFMSVLSFLVGGANTQQWLIEQQIMVTASRMKPDKDYVSDIRTLFDQCLQLGHSKQFARQAAQDEFRKLFPNSVQGSFATFGKKHEGQFDFDPAGLSKPMDDLFAYTGFLRYAGFLDLEEKVEMLALAKNLILQQINLLLKARRDESHDRLSNADWVIVFGLMARASKTFSFDEFFGIAGILLETNFNSACFLLHEELECGRCPCGNVLNAVVTGNGEKTNKRFCKKCGINYIDARTIKGNTLEIECPDCGCSAHRGGTADQFSCTNRNRHGSFCHRRLTKPIKFQSKHLFAEMCQGHLANQTLSSGTKDTPWFAEKRETFNVAVADSPRDPKHFGHLIWRFGKLLKLLKVTEEDLPPSAPSLPLPAWFVGEEKKASSLPRPAWFVGEEKEKKTTSPSNTDSPGQKGTRGTPFQATSKKDNTSTINLQSITAMFQYENKSFEELRFEDYSEGNKGQSASTKQTTAPFNFF